MKKMFNLVLLIFIAVVGIIGLSNISTETVGADSIESNRNIDFRNYAEDMFQHQKIIDIKDLYNFNDSADYFYVKLDYGYAVFLKKNLELLEYSETGEPFEETDSKIYYGGPTGYYRKTETGFLDIKTDEKFDITDTERVSLAEDIINCLSDKKGNNKEEQNGELRSGGVPSIVDEGYIVADLPGSTSTTYISNAQYFLSNPRHGKNSLYSCGAVATQLLLSYNNYYNDRRIIANEYLNGVWNGITNTFSTYELPEQNPNTCTNPLSMTRDVLGSNGYNETDAGTYFNKIFNLIPTNASMFQVWTGLTSLINERNGVDGDPDLGFALFGFAVDVNAVKDEIDEDRPLIVLMQNFLGGEDHYVVAYGYQNMISPTNGNEYTGYITHYGHSGNTPEKLNVWINSAWCYAYITLQINHTHTYVDSGIIYANSKRELQCSVCGHRTLDELLLDDGNGKITGCKYPIGTSIVVPSEINGVTITKIDTAAFMNNTTLTNVTLPSTITNIGRLAFYGCTNLTNINFPSSLTHIDDAAFYNCSSLQNVILPSGLIELDAGAFERCSSLSSITLYSNLTTLGSSVFEDCTGLQTVNIYSNITSLPYRLFRGCTDLETVILPSGITEIEEKAFYGCTSLETIYYSGTSFNTWNNITVDIDNTPLEDTMIYCYSLSQPTAAGNYWHYSYWSIPQIWHADWALTANGTDGIITTDQLTFTFDWDPGNITAADISVTGATKGTLTGTGNVRMLEVSGITQTVRR